MVGDRESGIIVAEQPLHEQPRRVGMRRARHHRGGTDAERGAIGRIDRLDRIALVDILERRAGRRRADQALAGIDQGERIVAGASDARIVLRQLFEVLPAIGLPQREHPDAGAAGERRMSGRHPALPFRIEQVGPGLRRVRRLRLLPCGRPSDATWRRRVIKPGSEIWRTAGNRPAPCGVYCCQSVALFQRRVLRDIGGTEHVALRRVVLQVLHQPLVRDLTGGADDSDLDAGIFLGERRPICSAVSVSTWAMYQVSVPSCAAASTAARSARAGRGRAGTGAARPERNAGG